MTGSLVAVLGGCGPGDRAELHPPAGISIERLVTSKPVPYSQNDGLALLSDDRACVFDSYEVRIVCGDRAWERTVRLGRKGAGPGELSGYGHLASGPDGTVALFDFRNQRVSRFGWTGLTGELPLHQLLTPAGELLSDSTIVAHAFPATGGPPQLRVVVMTGAEGRVVSELVLKLPASAIKPGMVMDGAVRAPDGRYGARISESGAVRLALFTTRGAFTGFLAVPRGDPVYPSVEDVQEFVEGYSRAFLGRRPADTVVRNFRKRPMRLLPRNTVHRTVQLDSRGRIWVLTTRRSREGTRVDVFGGTAYLGSVRLADRVRSIQIRDSMLVALTQWAGPGDVVPQRRLDWYRIR